MGVLPSLVLGRHVVADGRGCLGRDLAVDGRLGAHLLDQRAVALEQIVVALEQLRVLAGQVDDQPEQCGVLLGHVLDHDAECVGDPAGIELRRFEADGRRDLGRGEPLGLQQHGLVEHCSEEERLVEVGAGQVGSQTGPAQVASGQLALAQVAAEEDRVLAIGAAQVGPEEARVLVALDPDEEGLFEVRTGEDRVLAVEVGEAGAVHDGAGEVGIADRGALQVHLRHLGIRELRCPEVRTLEAGAAQVCRGEVRALQIAAIEYGARQVEASQVHVGEGLVSQVEAERQGEVGAPASFHDAVELGDFAALQELGEVFRVVAADGGGGSGGERDRGGHGHRKLPPA